MKPHQTFITNIIGYVKRRMIIGAIHRHAITKTVTTYADGRGKTTRYHLEGTAATTPHLVGLLRSIGYTSAQADGISCMMDADNPQTFDPPVLPWDMKDQRARF